MNLNNSAVTVFSQASAVVSYTNKSGQMQNITPEGALFKGGLALRALKDAAVLSAYEKAKGGRYRHAADVIGAAFGSISKAFDRVMGTPWANKQTMNSYLQAVERAETPPKGWTAKQIEAKALIAELRKLPGFEKADELRTIEGHTSEVQH